MLPHETQIKTFSLISESTYMYIRKLITVTGWQKFRSQVIKFLICCLVGWVTLLFYLDPVQMSWKKKDANKFMHCK